MCQVLGVARSGFYHWLNRRPSRYERENKEMLKAINQIYNKPAKRCYGSPRITMELRRQGFSCSRPRVARLMRKHRLRSTIKRRYKPTTNSNHNRPLSPNLLKQNFDVDAPNKVWVSDITYIRCQEGWSYLTVIIDLYNREVVGWSFSSRLTAKDTVVKALYQAIQQRHPTAGLIFHSDQGVQYVSEEFRRLLSLYKIKQSMSGRGNCYDNAVAESFFHTLKTESIYLKNKLTRTIQQLELFKYIDGFYNNIRLHSKLGYVSPREFGNKIRKVA